MLKLLALSVFLCFGHAAAENGLDAWLRYAPLPCATSKQGCDYRAPSQVIVLNSTGSTTGSPVDIAAQELQKGIKQILGKDVRVANGAGHNFCDTNSASSIIVGTVASFNAACNNAHQSLNHTLVADGFWLDTDGSSIQILGQNERGTLYGAFQYLSMLAQGNFSRVSYASNPALPVRWVNQWDNMDGSIERGYGGASIFFANGGVVQNLTRAGEYARLLASIGINAVVVNNVNANYTTISPANIEGLGRIADVFRPYGVHLALSLDFASPKELGGLTTYDPLNEQVISFWTNITQQIYARIPDMAGYLVKADSEGQPGPLDYNRTLAQGANLFAKALQPYNGILMFRAFVYNQLNESDWTADRAKAAVQFFQPLDGEFDDNVIIQIKYGPIDFQVREPASPLFANLLKTNTALELEITQEYLGQQCHLLYLPPLWQTVLDFDLRVQGKPSLVRDIVTGQRFNRPLGGSAGVVNVGTNTTWLGSHLSMSNLYAYGRLAWDLASDPEALVQDWIRLTFGLDSHVLDTITQMAMDSWPAYENYSGNLGIQTLTDILYTHFGPNPQSQDNNGWGQWTRADHKTIGMDRTVSNGTGYTGQYPPEVAQSYENLETTPDNLVLWFHHVNYTHKLHSGKTVIQHFYDAHYEGAQTAQTLLSLWESLEGKIDDERYSAQHYRQLYQAGHSIVWRDAIAGFYHNISGIPDEAGRVGNHPWRIEAENMDLAGYIPYLVSPFEAGSNYTAIVTSSNSTTGVATHTVQFPSGKYDLAINYYDLIGGISRWTVYLSGKEVGAWTGDHENTLGHAPSIYLDGHSASRITFRDISVRKGDILKIVGEPNGIEPAPLDYVSFLPPGIID